MFNPEGNDLYDHQMHLDDASKGWQLQIFSDGYGFPCSCCDKVFDCGQALGGHQRAHRNERSRLNQNSTEVQRFTRERVQFVVIPENIDQFHHGQATMHAEMNQAMMIPSLQVAENIPPLLTNMKVKTQGDHGETSVDDHTKPFLNLLERRMDSNFADGVDSSSSSVAVLAAHENSEMDHGLNLSLKL